MIQSFDQAEPIVITAPTARNGITLIQRLFNSSGKILIYGENRHFTEEVPTIVYQAYAMHSQQAAQAKAAMERFKKEGSEFWSSSLFPDTMQYMAAMVESFGKLVMVYQRCAEQDGFAHWGIKHPFTSIGHLDRFITILPSGRYLYIYRNLYDVVRSAKARKFIKNLNDVCAYTRRWTESVNTVLANKIDSLLTIKHEDLVADPEHWISQMEQFTGITGLNRDVMNRKINTFKGPADLGYSPNEYIPPEPLTQDEIQTVQQIAGPLLSQLGYEAPEPANCACPA